MPRGIGKRQLKLMLVYTSRVYQLLCCLSAIDRCSSLKEYRHNNWEFLYNSGPLGRFRDRKRGAEEERDWFRDWKWMESSQWGGSSQVTKGRWPDNLLTWTHSTVIIIIRFCISCLLECCKYSLHIWTYNVFMYCHGCMLLQHYSLIHMHNYGYHMQAGPGQVM